MKALICEMCGSTAIVRKDGLYVCQACGTKYSVNDEKSTPGATVRTDGPAENDAPESLPELKALAEEATENQDWNEAYYYYQKILSIEPDDWAANHYTQFYRAFLSGGQLLLFTELTSRLNVFQEAIPTLNRLLKQNFEGQNVAQKAVDAWDPVFKNCEALWNDNSRKIGSYVTFTTDRAKQHYIERLMKIIFANHVAIVDFMFALVQSLHSEYGTCIQNWYLPYAKTAAIFASQSKDCPKATLDAINSFIKNIDPNYTPLQKAGCYIATAVYGSYDCPQVWVLRRFRDFTLAETWYGRTFIHTYYALSPTLVQWFGKSRWFKAICLAPLDKLVAHLQQKGVANTPYADRQF